MSANESHMALCACPFCGANNDYQAANFISVDWYGARIKGFIVSCIRCGGKSGPGKNKAEAYENWNRREYPDCWAKDNQ